MEGEGKKENATNLVGPSSSTNPLSRLLLLVVVEEPHEPAVFWRRKEEKRERRGVGSRVGEGKEDERRRRGRRTRE